MALIKCPECGKEISDTAKNCIHCGYALKEENNAETPQTVVHIEAPKKGKSSKNFLVIGITLNLCCLLFTTLSTIGSSKAVNPFRDNKIMLIISIVAAVISLVYSLVLLAKPDLRNVKTTNCSCMNFFASEIFSSIVNPFCNAKSKLYASCAFLPFSIFSTAFQSVSLSAYSIGT